MIETLPKQPQHQTRKSALVEAVRSLSVGGAFKTENVSDLRLAHFAARELGAAVRVRKDERGGWVVRRVA